MGFENKTTDELIRLAKAGLGFTVNKDKLSSDDIDKILSAAAEGGAKITFTNETLNNKNDGAT
jgi:hypothetical protein